MLGAGLLVLVLLDFEELEIGWLGHLRLKLLKEARVLLMDYLLSFARQGGLYGDLVLLPFKCLH